MRRLMDIPDWLALTLVAAATALAVFAWFVWCQARGVFDWLEGDDEAKV